MNSLLNGKSPLTLVFSVIIISGCGGGGGGGAPPAPAPVQNQSATGVWQTSYVVTSGANAGETINAITLVSPTGTFYSAGINQSIGCAGVGFGQATVNGSIFSGTENGAVVTYTNVPNINPACTYPDGSTSATVTVIGTVTTGQSLVVTATGTTSLGTSLLSETVTYTYSSLNSVAPSYSTIAGTYTTPDGSTATISSTGAISIADVVTGCTISGQFTIPSATNNIYEGNVTYSGCSVIYAALDGLTSSGLATFDNSVSPNQLDIGFSAGITDLLGIVAETWVQ